MNQLFLLAWLVAGLLLTLVATPAMAQTPTDTDAKTTDADDASGPLPTLAQLDEARRLTRLLAKPLVLCRQQLAPQQLAIQVKLGRLDGLEKLASRHRSSLPQVKLWNQSIRDQKQRLTSD